MQYNIRKTKGGKEHEKKSMKEGKDKNNRDGIAWLAILSLVKRISFSTRVFCWIRRGLQDNKEATEGKSRNEKRMITTMSRKAQFCSHTLRKSAIVPARRVKLLRVFNHFFPSTFPPSLLFAFYVFLGTKLLVPLVSLLSRFVFNILLLIVLETANEFQDKGTNETEFLTHNRDLCATRRAFMSKYL